jgi:lipid A 4'-phosphatase
MLLMIGLLVGLMFSIRPDVDVALTRPFFDPTTKHFPLIFNPAMVWLRDQAPLIVFATLACTVASILIKLARPSKPTLIPTRATIFLIATFALGPGLLVNGILKEHWSRPRPAEIVEFGGDKQFVAWWDPRGTCDQNCSFVSGETSTAAWTLAPAILIPGPLGTVATGAALLVTIGMATMRFVVGGHFFTDIAFAILFTWLIIWTVHGLIYRWPRTALREQAVENGLARFGLFVRSDLPDLLRQAAASALTALHKGVVFVRKILRTPASSERSRLQHYGLDDELLGRVQDLREAYFGAPEGRIVAEALELFIADRLKAEPELKRRYDEARRRRLGLEGTVRLLSTENPQHRAADTARPS